VQNKKGLPLNFVPQLHQGTTKVQIFNKQTTTKAKQTDTVKH
jgi:hypothetical protein